MLMAAAVKACHYGISYFIVQHYDKKLDQIKTTDPSKEQALQDWKQTTCDKVSRFFDGVATLLVGDLGKCGNRIKELEADKYGMCLLYKASLSPGTSLNPSSAQAAIWLQAFFIHQKPPERRSFFAKLRLQASRHPSNQERLNAHIKTWEEICRNQAVMQQG